MSFAGFMENERKLLMETGVYHTSPTSLSQSHGDQNQEMCDLITTRLKARFVKKKKRAAAIDKMH
jgi:hypothetical protein